jgi:hypothetical protein
MEYARRVRDRKEGRPLSYSKYRHGIANLVVAKLKMKTKYKQIPSNNVVKH